jgi:SAM-dependent methyltransferase
VAGTAKGGATVRHALPTPGSVPSSGIVGWINRWRLTARLYEPLWRHRSITLLSGGARSTEREIATMQAWLRLPSGAEVLDLGCSAGLYARRLAAAGASLSALDQSLAFLHEASRLAECDGVTFEVVQADAHALPYLDSSFDAVVIGASINEFADPERALREVARVLRPDGRLWLMYARRAGPVGRPLQWLLRLATLRFPDPLDVEGWAIAAGLTPLRREEHGAVVFALFGRGSSLPNVATTSLLPEYQGPPLRSHKRHNWESGGKRR